MAKINNPKIIILITVLLIFTYASALSNLFVWDDAWNIVSNQFIKSWKNFPLLFNQTYLTTFEDFGFLGERQIGSGEVSYRPVTTLTYFIDYAFWGLNPFGYHLTNILLHLLNAILLYFFASQLTNNKRIGLFSALLFALHPVNSEAVAVVSFREDLLAFLFFITSLIFYIKINASCGRKKTIFYVLSLASFLLALFSKEMAFTLPLILILYDFYFSPPKKSKLYYLGYIVIALFSLWVWIVLLPNPEKALIYPGGNFFTSLFTMSGVITTYVSWVIWPIGVHAVVPDNSVLVLHSFTPRILIYLLLITVIIFFALKKSKTAKVISFSIFWFFIALLPVYNLVPVLNTIMGSRFLYIPLAGFCLCAATFLCQAKISRQAAVVLMVLILLLYSALTIKRNRVYKNNISLWSEMVKFYPASGLAHTDLGAVFEKNGLLDKAIAEYKIAIQLDPNSTKAYFGLGNCYYVKNLLPEALNEYKNGLKLIKSKTDLERALIKLKGIFQAHGMSIDEEQ